MEFVVPLSRFDEVLQKILQSVPPKRCFSTTGLVVFRFRELFVQRTEFVGPLSRFDEVSKILQSVPPKDAFPLLGLLFSLLESFCGEEE
ncbi:hypothetical protein CEXT_145741 [Caerostris extrusa]|uniref:Uncharacterized protein n=1 Tax=Caerostris extrusa TaxID=172846 RepID=A0AAV4WAS6_CAEEX|nr:hypothetical protein CEXT_145741 [Caerostris extrusa]